MWLLYLAKLYRLGLITHTERGHTSCNVGQGHCKESSANEWESIVWRIYGDGNSYPASERLIKKKKKKNASLPSQ